MINQLVFVLIYSLPTAHPLMRDYAEEVFLTKQVCEKRVQALKVVSKAAKIELEVICEERVK